LSVTKDKRHPFQHNVINMADEVLVELQKELETAVSNADSTLADSAGEKQRRELAACETKTKLEAAETLEGCRLMAMTEAKATGKTNEAALVEAKKQEKFTFAQFDKVSARKTSLENIISTQLEPMKSAGGGKREINVLTKALGAFEGFDASLMQALPTALAKPAEEYTSFNKLVVQRLEEALSAVKSKLDAELQTFDTAEKATAKEAAQDAFNKAKEAYESAHNEHEEAVKSTAAAKEALRQAEDAQNSFDADMREVASKMDRANEALAAFKSGPLETFTELKNKETPAEPAEQVILPQEVPAGTEDGAAEAAAE